MATTMTTEEMTRHPYLCEDCEMELAIHVFVNLENKEYHLCEKCNEEAWEAFEEQQRAEEEEDRKREKEDAAYAQAMEEVMFIREGVWGEGARAEVEEEEEGLGICVSCREKDAKITFMHLTNGNFELCIRCFEWADHERDYGTDFGCSSSEDDGDY